MLAAPIANWDPLVPITVLGTRSDFDETRGRRGPFHCPSIFFYSCWRWCDDVDDDDVRPFFCLCRCLFYVMTGGTLMLLPLTRRAESSGTGTGQDYESFWVGYLTWTPAIQ